MTPVEVGDGTKSAEVKESERQNGKVKWKSVEGEWQEWQKR